MQIGARIYYDKVTGNVIVNTGHRSGGVVETTQEQDFAAYAVLKERVIETVGVIQLNYGEYERDFAECDGYRVDPATKQILFSYPDPNLPEEPPVYQPPLTEQVAELKSQNSEIILTLVMNDLM